MFVCLFFRSFIQILFNYISRSGAVGIEIALSRVGRIGLLISWCKIRMCAQYDSSSIARSLCAWKGVIEILDGTLIVCSLLTFINRKFGHFTVSFGSNEPVIMMFPMKFGYIILKYDGQRDSVKTSIIEAVLFCFEVFRRYVVLWSVPTVCCVFHFITNYDYVSSRVCDNGLRQWLVWCYCSGVNEAVLSLKRFHIFLSKISV